jgi:hypothetical protein
MCGVEEEYRRGMKRKVERGDNTKKNCIFED